MDSVENSCQILVLAGIALVKGDAWMLLGYFATSFLVSAQDINLPVGTLGQGYGHSEAYSGSCDVSPLTYKACLLWEIGRDTGNSLPPVMMVTLVSAASVIVLQQIYSVGY